MAYIHFTQEQKEQARHTDIAAMLMSRGETVKRSGSEFEWLDGGAKVTIRGNLWYHQYEQKGGDAIEFVKRFMDKTYPEAVEYLLGGSVGTIVSSSYEPKKKEPVEFEMPEKSENSRRAFAYLHFRRGIDKDVLNTFFRKGLIAGSVTVTANEDVTARLIKDGETVEYTVGESITEAGEYALTLTDGVGNTAEISFTVIKPLVKAFSYNFDEMPNFEKVVIDGEEKRLNYGTLELFEDGVYEVGVVVGGETYTFTVTVDDTAPTLTLGGVENVF